MFALYKPFCSDITYLKTKVYALYDFYRSILFIYWWTYEGGKVTTYSLLKSKNSNNLKVSVFRYYFCITLQCFLWNWGKMEYFIDFQSDKEFLEFFYSNRLYFDFSAGKIFSFQSNSIWFRIFLFLWIRLKKKYFIWTFLFRYEASSILYERIAKSSPKNE